MGSFTEKELRIYEEKILKQPQPLPDKRGFKQFLILIGIVFAIFVFALLRGPRGRLEDGLLFTIASDPSITKNLELWHIFEFAKFLPAIGIFFCYSTTIPFVNKHIWKDKDPLVNLPPVKFWLRNFKIALSIASFFFFFSLETFSRGEYNGLFYSGLGQPAYIIALGYLVASTLYIINAFFPLIKRLRPKYGKPCSPSPQSSKHASRTISRKGIDGGRIPLVAAATRLPPPPRLGGHPLTPPQSITVLHHSVFSRILPRTPNLFPFGVLPQPLFPFAFFLVFLLKIQ